MVVTRREERAYPGFGASVDDEDVAIQVAGVGERAAQAVRASFQVVIWDPVAGRNDLWAVLKKISHSSASFAVRADHQAMPP